MRMPNLFQHKLDSIIQFIWESFRFNAQLLIQEYTLAKKGNADINFNQFVQKYFSDKKSLDKMDPIERKALYEKVSSNIADMEGNGVYFPDEIKEELEKRKKES
jgi:hypothetical protein